MKTKLELEMKAFSNGWNANKKYILELINEMQKDERILHEVDYKLNQLRSMINGIKVEENMNVEDMRFYKKGKEITKSKFEESK